MTRKQFILSWLVMIPVIGKIIQYNTSYFDSTKRHDFILYGIDAYEHPVTQYWNNELRKAGYSGWVEKYQ